MSCLFIHVLCFAPKLAARDWLMTSTQREGTVYRLCSAKQAAIRAYLKSAVSADVADKAVMQADTLGPRPVNQSVRAARVKWTRHRKVPRLVWHVIVTRCNMDSCDWLIDIYWYSLTCNYGSSIANDILKAKDGKMCSLRFQVLPSAPAHVPLAIGHIFSWALNC